MRYKRKVHLEKNKQDRLISMKAGYIQGDGMGTLDN
jgi:hypothetical protein